VYKRWRKRCLRLSRSKRILGGNYSSEIDIHAKNYLGCLRQTNSHPPTG
jgi:hypothetical protein